MKGCGVLDVPGSPSTTATPVLEDRPTATAAVIRAHVLTVAAGYHRPLADRDAWRRLEHLSSAVRAAERADHDLGGDLDEVLALAAALEDSLVLLAISTDTERRGQAVDPAEVATRVVALEREPRRHRGARRHAPRGGLTRLEELTRAIRPSLSDIARSYVALAPDGRVLSLDEKRDVRIMLEEGATCLRIVARQRHPLDEDCYAEHLAPVITVARSIQRSLVLALSADPRQRAAALTVAQLSVHGRRCGLRPRPPQIRPIARPQAA